MAEMAFTLKLGQIGSQDVQKVGTKATDLAEAQRVGIYMPASFVIPNNALAEFLTGNGILPEVLKMNSIEDAQELREQYSKVRALFTNARIPDEYRESILESYLALPAQRSTTVHDLLAEQESTVNVIISPESRIADESAGILMNIMGKKQVLDAIKTSWLSLFLPENASYRKANSFSFNAGIIVQVMPATRATVEVTTKPDVGDYGIVVHTYHGLADLAAKSKKDRYEVSKPEGKIVSRRIENQDYAVLASDQPGTLIKRRLLGENDLPKVKEALVIEAAMASAALQQALAQDFIAVFSYAEELQLMFTTRMKRD